MPDASEMATALLRRYHVHGDEDAREALVTEMLPLARGLARRYAHRGEPLEDLEQVASLGLVKAIDRFDCARDVKFTTFAVPTIAGELKRHFRDRTWMVRVPRAVQELTSRLSRAQTQLEHDLSRPPTVLELAHAAGATFEQTVEALNAAGAYRAFSLDQSPGADEGEPAGELGDRDDGYERVEQRVLLRDGFAELGERERQILLLRFFEGLTQREIADRVGISQMHVSRLIRHSIAALRASLTTVEPAARTA